MHSQVNSTEVPQEKKSLKKGIRTKLTNKTTVLARTLYNTGTFFKRFNYVCMSVLPAWMCVYHVLAWYPQKPEENIAPLELEIQIVVRCPMGTGK